MGKHRHEKVAKMGHMPGDIPRRDKIHMMETGTPLEMAGWTIPAKAQKTFRNVVRKKAKAKIKRRLDREMLRDE